jgi:predicted RNA-binding Zn-ribbon protein involved in translation (DUF1610 family)
MKTKTIQNIINLARALPKLTGAELAQLLRAERTLHRWAERECGDGSGWHIERDDESYCLCSQCGYKHFGDDAAKINCPKCGDVAPIRHIATGIPYNVRDDDKRRYRIADREQGAVRTCHKIAQAAGYSFYWQRDCRGCQVYILRPEDIKPGEKVESVYTRGVAVYA